VKVGDLVKINNTIMPPWSNKIGLVIETGLPFNRVNIYIFQMQERMPVGKDKLEMINEAR
tara:strand:+ start:10260 stop:10439 length:180 start_codon:yes stop_codon:yes gene_type:complete